MKKEEFIAKASDIIAGFQEGFNTNLHCLELARALSDEFEELLELTPN